MARTVISFEASARLQRLIGRGLVPNDEMAIVELVKNAYDSGASKVRIFVQPEREKAPGLIRVSDDGSGMSTSDIEKLFMFAGFSARSAKPQFGDRITTGEKGIGRFATDKLGRTLDVYTVKRNSEGLHLHIDWTKFEVSGTKKFNEITATYETKDVSNAVRTRTGTVLEIKQLNETWDSSKIDKLKVWLKDLLNPYAKPNDFLIELEVAGTKAGPVIINATPPDGDLTMILSVKGGKVRRKIKDKNDNNNDTSETTGSAAELASLGGLQGRFVHFDRRPRKDQTKGLEPGVRVYRDGFRIEPFGSRSADWLGVAEKRAKRAGHAHIVPNRLFGFIEISRQTNPDLSDTTSRQALLDTAAARNLVTVLKEGLNALAEVVRTRTEPRWKENRERKQAELEKARLHTLGEVASGLAHELRQPLQAIRSEADNIKEILKSIGYEGKDIEQAQRAIDRGVERIDKSIKLVSSLSKGDMTDVAEVDLAELIQTEVDFHALICHPKGINISYQGPRNQIAMANEAAIYSIVTNILRNAMQAIETSNGVGSISVTLRKLRSGHRVEIEDDGGGVSEEVRENLFKKFATKKTGGMGVGLYYCKVLVELHEGKIGHHPTKKGSIFWIELPEN